MSKFDPAAILVAARAAATAKPVPVHLAGVGDVYKRKLTVADIEAAGDVRAKMQAAGKLDRQMNIAIGLAQSICGPNGEQVFDVNNDDHLGVLAALPWESVRGVVAGYEGNG